MRPSLSLSPSAQVNYTHTRYVKPARPCPACVFAQDDCSPARRGLLYEPEEQGRGLKAGICISHAISLITSSTQMPSIAPPHRTAAQFMHYNNRTCRDRRACLALSDGAIGWSCPVCLAIAIGLSCPVCLVLPCQYLDATISRSLPPTD